MSTKRGIAVAAGAFALALGFSAQADDTAPSVLIDGKVKHALQLSAADLRVLPQTKRDVTFETDHGERKASFTGVLLWTLIDRAKIDDPAKFGELRHVVAATGADGYFVMFSAGEIDPNFGNAPIMVAYQQDGKPLAGLRIVAPGDRHGARDVRDLVHLEIR